jgi:hypothetical protein
MSWTRPAFRAVTAAEIRRPDLDDVFLVFVPLAVRAYQRR